MKLAVSNAIPTQYTVLNGFLTKAESDKEEITYLMKQVIYRNTSTIMFLVPNRQTSHQVEITFPICERSCEYAAWPFKNEMVNCCDLTKTEFFENYNMLRKNPVIGM